MGATPAPTANVWEPIFPSSRSICTEHRCLIKDRQGGYAGFSSIAFDLKNPQWAMASFTRNYPLYKPLHYLKQTTWIIIKWEKWPILRYWQQHG